jgi:cobalt/nickel transport system permease protein
MIPDWMKEIDTNGCPCCSASVGSHKNFTQKGILNIINFLRATMDAEAYSKRVGLLQTLDPRVKMVSILAFIVAVSMTHDIHVLLIVYPLTIVLAYLSKIDLLFFIKRVWLFIPIFAGVITLPIIFNVFMPGDGLVTLVRLGPNVHIGPFLLPEVISITRQGTMIAVIFTLRVATCVSAGVLLFLTTRRDVLFKSLRSLGVPSVYVLTLDMSYRYIFLFMDMVKDFYVSKKSRTIQNRPLREEQKWVGGRIGYTLVKSLDMGEKVHKAMVSRGFDGNARIMNAYRMRGRDYAAGFSTLLFSGLLVAISLNMVRI